MKIIAIIGLAGAVTNCGSSKKSLRQTNISASVQRTDGGGEGEQKPSSKPTSLTTSVGVRNFAQLNATMSALTGVPTTNSSIARTYADLSSQLPVTYDLGSFAAAQQVAIFKLATDYCDRLFENTDLRRAILPNIDFSAAPNVALTTEKKSEAVVTLLDRFWGKDHTNRPSNDAVRTELITLFDEILTQKNMTNVALTRNSVKGICTAVLAAAPVSIY